MDQNNEGIFKQIGQLSFDLFTILLQLQAVCKYFPDWHREESVKELTICYYRILYKVVRDKPSVKRHITRCVDCGIYFITDPRNKDRADLRCPFGCRDAHRRRCSNERSTVYYQTANGKYKKRLLNQRRCRRSEAPSVVSARVEDARIAFQDADVGLSVPFLVYLQSVARVVEGRAISLAAIRMAVRKILRQHSIDLPVSLHYSDGRHVHIPP